MKAENITCWTSDSSASQSSMSDTLAFVTGGSSCCAASPAIIFGLITFFAPDISLAALVLVFGAYVFADGVLAIISAIRRRGEG